MANDRRESLWVQDMPLEMVSFGACEADGYLYIHGGHKGKSHTYSKNNHENVFLRIKLEPRGEWEKLKSGDSISRIRNGCSQGTTFKGGRFSGYEQSG